MDNKFPDKYSLSLVQQDIFYDQLHHIGSPKYNIGGYVNLGAINEAKLKDAHSQLVSTNRMFAMQLVNQADGVFVSLNSLVNTELPFIDLSHEENPEQSAAHWIDEAFSQPFDLYDGALFNAFLLKISNDQYFYVGIAHHLMIDGLGFANWARQLGNYYSNDLPELETQEDFLAYYTQDFSYLQSTRYAKDKAFWKNYLADQPVRLFSPLRTRAMADNEKCSQRLCFDISKELLAQVLTSSAILQRNEHSVFFALVALYFSRITQRNSITVGVPAHNRRGAAHKRFVGLFTSVSPVKIAVQDSWSFEQLVETIKTEQVKVFRHQKYPIGHMVRDIGPAARAGLFDIGVNYLKQNNKFDYGDFFAHICYFQNDYQTTPFNLTVWDGGEHQPVQLQIDFNWQYFTADDIRLIGARLLHLLQQIATNPHILLGDLDVFAPTEHALIRPPVLPSPVVPATPFIHLFEQQVATKADCIALSYLQQQFTYWQLNQLAELLAQRLAARGVSAGHLVGLLLGRGPHVVIAILALHKLGAAYLPLDPSYPAARLQFMLDDSQCRLLLATSDVQAIAAGFAVQTLLLDDSADLSSLEQVSPVELHIHAAHEQQLAYVIYTSGSTGKPKGVMVSQRALSNFLQSMAIEPGFGPRDYLLAVTPFSFDISILELLLPLLGGGTVRIFHTALTQDVAGLIHDLQQYPVTHLQMTPSAWKLLLAAGWQGAQELTALAGGEALPVHVAETLGRRVKQLWNMYGPTETTIWSSCYPVHLPMTCNSIGKPIANTHMRVLDGHFRTLPVGVFGDLYIGGTGLAEGYLHQPELTAERFIRLNGQRWYQSGDVARLLANGEFEFQGRADHQIKLNGYRIELGEIESLLSRYPGITNNAVLIKTLASGRQVLCAYYQSDAALDDVALKAALAVDLPAFMLPSAYLHVPLFPQTPSGKTDLKALPEPGLIAVNTPASSGQVYDEFTGRLLALIKAQLPILQLEPTDNFFDAGATSMDVMELPASINRELGLSLTVIDFFSHPSVRALANHLQGQNSVVGQQSRARRQEAAARGKSRLHDRLIARKLLDEV